MEELNELYNKQTHKYFCKVRQKGILAKLKLKHLSTKVIPELHLSVSSHCTRKAEVPKYEVTDRDQPLC